MVLGRCDVFEFVGITSSLRVECQALGVPATYV